MKRMKWLLMNCLILVVIAVIYCVEHNLYLSKKKCVEEAFRTDYIEFENLYEMSNIGFPENPFWLSCVELIAESKDTQQVWSVTLFRKGPFYELGGIDELTLHRQHQFELVKKYRVTADDDIYLIMARYNEKIDVIERTADHGELIRFDEWKGNYSLGIIESKTYQSDCTSTYRAYNASGNLIEEIKGLN